MAKNRLKTKSKKFYDDEVLFTENGEVHLRTGVKRLSYGTELNYNDWRGQIIDTTEKPYKADNDEINDIY